MANQSYDDWANDLANHINAKNPQTPIKTETKEDDIKSILNGMNNNEIAVLLRDLFETRGEHKLIADIIMSIKAWETTEAGVNFWSTIHTQLEEGKLKR